jgi:hypothetical protein
MFFWAFERAVRFCRTNLKITKTKKERFMTTALNAILEILCYS